MHSIYCHNSVRVTFGAFIVLEFGRKAKMAKAKM